MRKTLTLADGRLGFHEPTELHDRWHNRLDRCECGALKLERASRCKPCGAAAQVGVPKARGEIGEGATRYRARKLCAEGPCVFRGCDADGAQVHHIDGDPFNNDLGNLVRLCARHHMTVDGRPEASRARAAEVGRLGGRKKKAA